MRLLLAFICLLYCQGLMALGECQVYSVALDTIAARMNAPKTGLGVNDHIHDMDRWGFADEFDKTSLESHLLRSYARYKGYVYYEPYYSECLHHLQPPTPRTQHLVFFSHIEDNMLIAEVFSIESFGFVHWNSKEPPTQGQGTSFLFVLSENGTITKAFHHTMHLL